MKIVILDAASLGADVDLSPILNLGEATVYEIKKDFINYEIKRTDSSVITIK